MKARTLILTVAAIAMLAGPAAAFAAGPDATTVVRYLAPKAGKYQLEIENTSGVGFITGLAWVPPDGLTVTTLTRTTGGTCHLASNRDPVHRRQARHRASDVPVPPRRLHDGHVHGDRLLAEVQRPLLDLLRLAQRHRDHLDDTGRLADPVHDFPPTPICRCARPARSPTPRTPPASSNSAEVRPVAKAGRVPTRPAEPLTRPRHRFAMTEPPTGH